MIWPWILAGIGVVLVILVIWVISSYNKLVQLRNKAEDQWSQVDVQLKKRFDLIPNIVETVKGYAGHEKDTLQSVVEARNSALSAATPDAEMHANQTLSGALTKLFALSEAYPELKADRQFVELQKNLREVEDKIAYARQFYNDSVLTYKNATETFPTNLVAKMFGFCAPQFFEASDEEKSNVKVEF